MKNMLRLKELRGIRYEQKNKAYTTEFKYKVALEAI
jgi:hypothetical protein